MPPIGRSYVLSCPRWWIASKRKPQTNPSMELSGYHHNVAYEFLSLRPALYAAGTGEVRFQNFRYRTLE